MTAVAGTNHRIRRVGHVPDGGEFTVGVARFVMETCTFCPRPTGIEEFEHHGPPVRGDDVLDANPYVRGFVDRTRERSDADLVGLSSPRRPVGGSSGSWVTRNAFEKYAAGIVDDVGSVDPDAVYLSLHGAMAVDGVPKPEAELARCVRDEVGDRPLYVTLDLHANVDGDLASAADAVFTVKRYPHYDAHRQGERAARLLHRQHRGTYEPTVATREPGVITPSVFQATADSPAMEIMERARRWEAREPGAFVSVAFGFAYADVPTAGATVMAVTNDDPDLAAAIADDVSAYIWRVRESFAGKQLPETTEGVAQAIEAADAGRIPVVLADHADRTGNSTHLLAELRAQGAKNAVVASIADPRVLDELRDQAAVGETVTVEIGGYADEYAGEPVEVTGEVEYLGRYGGGRYQFDTLAVLRFGDGNRVFVTPQLHQVMSPAIFERVGIDFESEIDVVVLKSRVHFRRGFVETGVAETVVEVDAPGLGPADLTRLDYENVPPGLYPIDDPGNGEFDGRPEGWSSVGGGP